MNVLVIMYVWMHRASHVLPSASDLLCDADGPCSSHKLARELRCHMFLQDPVSHNFDKMASEAGKSMLGGILCDVQTCIARRFRDRPPPLRIA